MWKEENRSTDMMSINIDMGWCVSPVSDWELFGGEIKLSGVSSDCDDDSLHAGGSQEVGNWQTMEDDALSVCSSATSWSCLHGSGLLETYSEMYSDLSKPEEEKFAGLLADDLIDDITSCMDSGLLSLEQFYEINHLIDCDTYTESSDPPDVLLDMIEHAMADADSCEVREADTCESDENVVVKLSDCTIDVPQFSVNYADYGTDPESPDSAVASLEFEELYEESVAVEDGPSTISYEDMQNLMAGSCHQTSKSEQWERAETSPCASRHRAPTQLTTSRRLRKKEQNKSAALRYRLKKRSEQGVVLSEYAMLERRNIELRTRIDSMTKEMSYLKSLIDEICP